MGPTYDEITQNLADLLGIEAHQTHERLITAQQVRQGICQRGVTTRQRARLPGPLCPTTVANNLVKWNVRDLEAVFNGSSRAVATAGVFGAKVTGIAEGTELETTARYTPTPTWR